MAASASLRKPAASGPGSGCHRPVLLVYRVSPPGSVVVRVHAASFLWLGVNAIVLLSADLRSLARLELDPLPSDGAATALNWVATRASNRLCLTVSPVGSVWVACTRGGVDWATLTLAAHSSSDAGLRALSTREVTWSHYRGVFISVHASRKALALCFTYMTCVWALEQTHTLGQRLFDAQGLLSPAFSPDSRFLVGVQEVDAGSGAAQETIIILDARSGDWVTYVLPYESWSAPGQGWPEVRSINWSLSNAGQLMVKGFVERKNTDSSPEGSVVWSVMQW